MGLIAVGRIADIVGVGENPVKDIANLKTIHLVVLRGEMAAFIENLLLITVRRGG